MKGLMLLMLLLRPPPLHPPPYRLPLLLLPPLFLREVRGVGTTNRAESRRVVRGEQHTAIRPKKKCEGMEVRGSDESLIYEMIILIHLKEKNRGK